MDPGPGLSVPGDVAVDFAIDTLAVVIAFQELQTRATPSYFLRDCCCPYARRRVQVYGETVTRA